MESPQLRILITGASGFIGSHLMSCLEESVDGQVIPVARSHSDQMYACDLCDKTEVSRLLKSARPTRIFHCAGSFADDLNQDFRNNVLTTHNLLETILELELCCRVLLIGSSAEYGIPDSGSGVFSETHPLKPASIYGLSKLFQSKIMSYYLDSYDMDIVMARIFNLDGEGISPKLFPGHVRSEIRDYLSGKAGRIKVGNLAAYRDYLPVDVAISYLTTIMEHGDKGEVYNVGSGSLVQMRTFLESLLDEYQIDKVAIEVNDSLESKSKRVISLGADVSKIRKLLSD